MARRPDGGKYAKVPEYVEGDVIITQASIATKYETRVPECCEGGVSDAVMAKLFERFKIELPAKKIRNPPTICMVPMELRRGDDNGCYDPVAVQIGLRRRPPAEVEEEVRQMKNTEELRKGLPQELQALEQYKSSCVVQLISRRPDKEEIAVSSGNEMNYLCFYLTKYHTDIYEGHSNPTSLGSGTYKLGTGRTMAIDGCFILHRLLKYAHLADREAAKKKTTTQGGEGGGEEDDGWNWWVHTGACRWFACFAWQQLMTRETLVRKQGEKSSEDDDKAAAAAGGEQGGSSENDDDDYGNDDWTQTGGRCFVWQLVTRDLLLLENQIPFWVIRVLFEKLKNKNENNETLVKGGLMLFRALCPQMLPPSDPVPDIAKELDGVHHLLHLFYLMVGCKGIEHSARPGEKKTGAKNEKTKPPPGFSDDVLPSELPQWIPGAKELLEAGIRLRMRKNATTFFDIMFDDRSGVLEIPPLLIYDHSEVLFRNMIAFEQTYPRTRCDISTYSVFMNCLVSTAEDARILHLRGVLVNMMNGGDQDGGRHFFDRICSQIHFPSDNYLVHTMAGVNRYMQSRRHRWRAALVRDYFSNPWVAISVVAAVFLLCLTVLQTVFTVYPYFKPSE